MIEDHATPDPARTASIGQRAIRATIRALQKMEPGLLAGEGCKNFWDEYCVQIQRDELTFGAIYEETGRAALGQALKRLTTSDRLALWLETYAGGCLRYDEESINLAVAAAAVKDLDIVNHLEGELNTAAQDYSNRWIRLMTE